MPPTGSPYGLIEHAPQNVMSDAGEIARFHDRCSDLMRELLDALAGAPDRPRSFPQIEDAIGWPRRRIASVLGGVSHLRHTEFGGRRPYHFQDDRPLGVRPLGAVDGRRPGTGRPCRAALDHWLDRGRGHNPR